MPHQLNRQVDKIDLPMEKELTKYLKRGDQAKIAKLLGVDRSTVTHSISGKHKNTLVMEYVKAFSEKRKAEMEAKINNAFGSK